MNALQSFKTFHISRKISFVNRYPGDEVLVLLPSDTSRMLKMAQQSDRTGKNVNDEVNVGKSQ
jgi:hypothetical protein